MMKACMGMLILLTAINAVAVQAQEPEKQPQDFIVLELAIGTLGAIGTPIAAFGTISIVCYLETIERCSTNRAKQLALIPLSAAFVAGPGLGAALGVWWVGSKLGVQGNVTMAFVGGLLGEALAILTMPIVLAGITNLDSSNISWLEMLGGSIYLAWFFIAPAAGAT
uniref:Uncharacterized protein n=2 Tax=Candidatus Bipolaricaulota TaxID=67810 RepID=H5SNJ1_9BACT|nr:hypothetical protein HGMM_F52D02C06 [uncultured Acetothermia bacterium]BAL59055.1 hypothetical protein HGMM_OP3C210 [Candidatus Acetothermum autotrophicum]